MNKNWKKKISYFLSGQAVSLFGSALVQYAIIWYITLNTKSGLYMTISIICGFLPMFFISPFAGVWADRYNRKTLIALSDSLIAVSTFILAIVFLLGYDKIWLLFAISVIRSIGSGIQSPAVSAHIPHLVPQEKLTKVNAAVNTIHSGITLVSPLISGALLSFATIEIIFFIDVFTAAIAIFILLFFLKETNTTVSDSIRKSYFDDMSKGIRYIFHHKFLRTVCFFNIIFFILIGPLSFLTPLQVTRNYGEEVMLLTAIEIAFSAGMILGGIIIGAWGGFKNRHISLVLSNIIIAFATISFGIIWGFWIYLVIMSIIGLVLPLFNIPFTTLLQQKVDKEYMGRVFGVFHMITSFMMPIGMIFYGPLADRIAIEYLMFGTGSLMLLLSIGMYFNKALSEAGRPHIQIKEENVQ